MPAWNGAGTTQDRAKRREKSVGVPGLAWHTWLRSGISVVRTADEPSIGGEYDRRMT